MPLVAISATPTQKPDAVKIFATAVDRPLRDDIIPVPPEAVQVKNHDAMNL
jgi:hypothetical protein